MARTALKKLGYRILTANNGAEALAIYAKAPDAVDAVLLDMTMPVMGGEETCKRLTDIRPDVVVVAMSGFDEREAKSRFGRGIGAFLQKPFTKAQLGATMGAIRRTSGYS